MKSLDEFRQLMQTTYDHALRTGDLIVISSDSYLDLIKTLDEYMADRADVEAEADQSVIPPAVRASMAVIDNTSFVPNVSEPKPSSALSYDDPALQAALGHPIAKAKAAKAEADAQKIEAEHRDDSRGQLGNVVAEQSVLAGVDENSGSDNDVELPVPPIAPVAASQTAPGFGADDEPDAPSEDAADVDDEPVVGSDDDTDSAAPESEPDDSWDFSDVDGDADDDEVEAPADVNPYFDAKALVEQTLKAESKKSKAEQLDAGENSQQVQAPVSTSSVSGIVASADQAANTLDALMTSGDVNVDPLNATVDD